MLHFDFHRYTHKKTQKKSLFLVSDSYLPCLLINVVVLEGSAEQAARAIAPLLPGVSLVFRPLLLLLLLPLLGLRANTPLNPFKGRNEQNVLLVLIRRRLVGRFNHSTMNA